VVERATLPEERTIDGTLETLPALTQVHAVASPALIVIGAVTRLHAVLAPLTVASRATCAA
jgi:siroheme synthase